MTFMIVIHISNADIVIFVGNNYHRFL